MGRLSLRKGLGQHHLVHGHLCRPLLEFLEPGGREVLEVGPGGGALTRELLGAGASVIAWELDPAWAFALPGTVRSKALSPVVGDALTIEWRRLRPGTLVAGNLPYGIATALIQRLLPHSGTVERAAFLVQLEVAERLAARPGEGAYGALSVLAAARAEVRLLGRVKPGSFRPRPEVEGAFVGFVLRPPPLPEAEMAMLEELVRGSFAHRRKTLRNALAGAWGRGLAGEVLGAAGLAPRVRAEELALEDFLALHRARGRLARGA